MAAAVCNPKFAKRRGQPWNLPQAPGSTSGGQSAALVDSFSKSLYEDGKAPKASGELDDERRNQGEAQ